MIECSLSQNYATYTNTRLVNSEIKYALHALVGRSEIYKVAVWVDIIIYWVDKLTVYGTVQGFCRYSEHLTGHNLLKLQSLRWPH